MPNISGARMRSAAWGRGRRARPRSPRATTCSPARSSAPGNIGRGDSTRPKRWWRQPRPANPPRGRGRRHARKRARRRRVGDADIPDFTRCACFHPGYGPRVDSIQAPQNTAAGYETAAEPPGRDFMQTTRRTLLKQSAAGLAVAGFGARLARAQEPSIRIGVIYDLTGPFAAAGSVACAIGAQIAIDLVNAKGGGARKYKVEPINADSQSKVDAAINEVERLIGQEKVEIVLGVYASAAAVPLSAKVEERKKILWITTAISTAVFKDKNLRYVFRGQIHSDQYGEAAANFIAENAKAKLGVDPKDVKLAIIHEDGPYGVGVAEATERFSKEKTVQV